VKITVEPRLLDHFGIAMYNMVPKAIAELCANSYDADASVVKITYEDDAITILDNGDGMTPRALEKDYLRLGRDRRASEGEETTSRGRAVIGNKGIGKLAGFGIAQTMRVRTWRRGKETSIRLDRAELEQAEDLGSFEIKPKLKKAKSGSHGTEIKLEDLLEDVNLPPEERLRAYLARHLPSKPDWSISVNGVESSADAIPGERHEISETIAGFGKVKGFYVVASDRRGLTPGFAVRIRDRIVMENSLFGINQQAHGFFNVVRIVGEIEPDFIDPVEGSSTRRKQFVINTSRSGFNPEDEGVQKLEEWAREKLESIAEGLAKSRASAKKKEAFQRNPEIEKRLDALGPDVRARLDATIDSVISKLSRNETDETIDQIIDLILRYYESDALRVILETIREAAPEEVDRLSRLLARYGAARLGEVASTLHTQIEVIEVLREKVREKVIEAEIHKIIAKNIWLLRDDLTYWFDNKSFATTLGDALAESFIYASGQRPDLACFDDSLQQRKQGDPPERLLVVEFKRPGIKISLNELMQVMQYKTVFSESLPGFSGDDIEVVILGDKFDSTVDRGAITYTMKSYDELLHEASDRYRELYAKLVPEGIPTKAVSSKKKASKSKKTRRKKPAKTAAATKKPRKKHA
jgi:hypothetical protein